jgi:hypothetical protein
VNPGRRGGKPAINRLSYGAACMLMYLGVFYFSSPRYIFCERILGVLWWAVAQSENVAVMQYSFVLQIFLYIR